MMTKKAINRNTYRVTLPVTKLHRPTVLYCKALYDHTLCAHVSKTLANVMTYPIETLRMWSLCPSNGHSHSLGSLYTGFLTYLPYCIFNNIATYHTFQTLSPICGNLYITSLLTCFLISCYKVPYNYFLKNKVIGSDASLKTFFASSFALRAMAASLSEEVPDLILKLTLKENVLNIFPFLHSFHASMVVAMATSLVMCPIEFFKTRILCGKMLVFTKQSVALKLLITIINMMVFQTSYDLLYTTVVRV